MKTLLKILTLVALASLTSHVFAGQTTKSDVNSGIQATDIKKCNSKECPPEGL
jgi:hypothetical protein